MLHVLFFDVAHQLFPAGQIGFQRARRLHWNDRHLIVSCIAPGNRAARGNQMHAPLKDQTKFQTIKSAVTR